MSYLLTSNTLSYQLYLLRRIFRRKSFREALLYEPGRTTLQLTVPPGIPELREIGLNHTEPKAQLLSMTMFEIHQLRRYPTRVVPTTRRVGVKVTESCFDQAFFPQIYNMKSISRFLISTDALRAYSCLEAALILSLRLSLKPTCYINISICLQQISIESEQNIHPSCPPLNHPSI